MSSQVEGVLLKQVGLKIKFCSDYPSSRRFDHARAHAHKIAIRDVRDSDGIRDISDAMRQRASCIIGNWMISGVNRRAFGT